MDLLAKAQARLAEIENERQELLSFIAMAQKLQGAPPASSRTVTINPPPRVRIRERNAPQTGVVMDTANIVMEHMRQHGDGLRTRDLLPIVEAAGIEVGGQNPIATLSARLGASRMFDRRGSQLFLRNEPENETADSHTNDTSAAS
ncbi:MAG: hypothetical protein H6915_00180 [Novosphingobium sp.]|nr:hypothetical protein [Novosphingobium sp.]